MTAELKPSEPWEGEWLWSCLFSQACALLKFLGKVEEGRGVGA